jgi:exonuclease III
MKVLTNKHTMTTNKELYYISCVILTIAIMSSLTVLSWNVKGIMSSTVCLSNLVKATDCDICVISEHKLKPRCFPYINTIEQGHECISKADTLPDIYNACHGKGGVAILYKSALQFYVLEISDINSERIVCIELKHHSYGSLFIFGVYLPSDESIEAYKHELNILDSLCTYYSNFGNVIIAGDLNASCQVQEHDRSNKYKSIELTKFIDRQFLSYAGNQIPFKGPNYTYTTKETMLDYILFNQGVISQLKSYEILSEGSISSTSDHLPIVVKIKLDYNPHRLLY